jgi:putative membrane protein
MRFVTIILTILLIVIGIAFAALNAKPVDINYLIGTTQLPLAVILLISLAIGMFLSVLMTGVTLIKLKAKNKWLEAKLKQ